MVRAGASLKQDKGGRTSFISISPLQRLLVIGFVLIYNLLLPGFSEVFHQPTLPLATVRFAVEFCYQFLLVLPFIYYKPDFGWLHPLILPLLWALARQYISQPETLLGPVRLFFEPLHGEWSHRGLPGFSNTEVAWTLLRSGVPVATGILFWVLFGTPASCAKSQCPFPQKRVETSFISRWWGMCGLRICRSNARWSCSTLSIVCSGTT